MPAQSPAARHGRDRGTARQAERSRPACPQPEQPHDGSDGTRTAQRLWTNAPGMVLRPQRPATWRRGRGYLRGARGESKRTQPASCRESRRPSMQTAPGPLRQPGRSRSAGRDLLGRLSLPPAPAGAGSRPQPPRWSRPAAMARSRFITAPVPAGISRPTITFSFSPVRLSTLPAVAASVSTRVVSWNEAAEMKLLVCSDALVMPCSTGIACAGRSSFGRAACRSPPRTRCGPPARRPGTSCRPDRGSPPSAASGERSPRCACR